MYSSSRVNDVANALLSLRETKQSSGSVSRSRKDRQSTSSLDLRKISSRQIDVSTELKGICNIFSDSGSSTRSKASALISLRRTLFHSLTKLHLTSKIILKFCLQ